MRTLHDCSICVNLRPSAGSHHHFVPILAAAAAAVWWVSAFYCFWSFDGRRISELHGLDIDTGDRTPVVFRALKVCGLAALLLHIASSCVHFLSSCVSLVWVVESPRFAENDV